MKNYKSKETMLVLTVFFLALFIIFKKNVFIYASVVIGFAGILSFYISGKVDKAWSWLSQVISTVTNSILLTVIFLIIVTPAALLRRLFKGNRFWKVDSRAQTNFSDRDHWYSKTDIQKMW